MRPESEHKLQNRLQNRSVKITLSVGAGEGNRTLDIQLGKVFDVSLFLLLFRLLMHPL
jgi:hypothetical protein